MLQQISSGEFFRAIFIMAIVYYGYMLILFRKEIVQLLRKMKLIGGHPKDDP